MTDIEITGIPPLTAKQRALVDMHSLLNIFNILRGELSVIGLTLAGDHDLLRDALTTCDQMVQSLSDPAAAPAAAGEVEHQIRTIQANIETTLVLYPSLKESPEIRESLDNLTSVFAFLRDRAQELLARLQAPDQWTEHSVASLRRNFLAVFSAIEKNSHGRYHLIYNVALKQPPDYYIDFKIESADGTSLQMPPVFQDVMRDLIANARKYTAPGGRITAALFAADDALYFHVEDTGRGIPPDELTKVVEFGRRASNVGDVRTMGGGFGLTKAFLVTQQFGGRFWIASELGVGTRIRILLPKPAALITGRRSSSTPWESIKVSAK
jgi:signal transduction histidine kinase